MNQIMTTSLILLHISIFAFSNSNSSLKLKTSENGSFVSLQDQTSKSLTANQSTDLSLSSPALINLEGRIPVLLVPVNAGSNSVELNPPTIKEATASAGQREMSQVISEIYIGIHEIQKDLQKNNVDRASQKIESLIKKYPDISFLHFTQGSVYFLQGKKRLARASVTKALQGHPNFQEGKDFLKAIGGPVKDSEGTDE